MDDCRGRLPSVFVCKKNQKTCIFDLEQFLENHLHVSIVLYISDEKMIFAAMDSSIFYFTSDTGKNIENWWTNLYECNE